MASAQPIPVSNGTANRLMAEDQPVHGWYRFVLSFPPHLVRHYLDRFVVGRDCTVLDPFCGTGTVLVECKKLGVPSVGMEAHPMAHFASWVKTDWAVEADELRADARAVARAVEEELAAAGIEDWFAQPQAAKYHDELRQLPEEEEKLLLKGSISPLPLHKSLVLRDRIRANADERLRGHELLALAHALCGSIGNLHFGPEVGVTKPKADAPVIAPWLGQVEDMCRDLGQVEAAAAVPSKVHLGDSRSGLGVLEPGSVGAVFTSPPSPTEKDYTRIIRLESVLLGFVRNRAELRAMKKHLVRSNTRTVYKDDDDDACVEDNREVSRVAEEIERRRVDLGKTSGFERQYAKVTKLYFGGMKRHLAGLRPYLAPGASLGYVVGDQASFFRVLIRTGEILAGIARGLGYEVIDLDLFRTRLATATKAQLREEVLVLRWPGG